MLVSSGIIRPTAHPVIERHNLTSRHPAPISFNVNVITSQPEPRSVQSEYAKVIWKQMLK